jgi:hypothetical protein
MTETCILAYAKVKRAISANGAYQSNGSQKGIGLLSDEERTCERANALGRS